MPTPTDQILAGYADEIQERQTFIDGLLQSAQDKGEDLDDGKLELITRARDRIAKLNDQMKPLEEARRISGDSKQRIQQLAEFVSGRERRPGKVEYRSAGAYAIDIWRAGLGIEDARERLEIFQRAAAHQTTGDNPGLLPEQIIAPVVNFVDESRPFVNALGPRQLPAGSWSRPRVTQHTKVGPQSAEKGELLSQKMVIGKIPVTAVTYGGYVNVSRQNVDWTQPQVMDIIIGDLAGQYAIETENAAVDAATAAATAGPTLPTGANTPEQVAGALWAAAGLVFNATKGQGRIIAVTGTDMLGMLGPMFPPVNPQDAQSTGFTAANFSTGPVGNIAGIPIYVSPGMAANTILVLSTAAAEVYEDRIGALQVVEPSVLGIQVAYAGYFAEITIEANGVQKIVKTP